MEKKNVWLSYTPEQKKEENELAERYKCFISKAKTERECVRETIRLAEAAGYRNLEEVSSLQPGDKVYAQLLNKTIALFHVGSAPLEQGLNILGAHIDSPRLDLKQNPLYEDTEQVLLDTHYYGGIKKYQWLALPLALHGVVAKKDGTTVDVCIGEKPEDPVFVISDLLPHLGADQMSKKASEFVPGEDLNVLVGSQPADADDAKEETKEEAYSVHK